MADHEKFCPASDVDLFLYGLNEEQAVEKIRKIEAAVRDGILTETTTVRTKNAITICSRKYYLPQMYVSRKGQKWCSTCSAARLISHRVPDPSCPDRAPYLQERFGNSDGL